ncbi:RDD family protein [Lacinutrix himadriensis]|uniref:RDD family protein n=1 Tax=Lacinutrix himadriensis TaxID=641549 RepID=UPI0006E18D72|nr:RDD family protein [Lacinutrix himadriensis]
MKDIYLKRFLAFLIDFVIVSFIYKILDDMLSLSFEITELTLFETKIKLSFSFMILSFYFYMILFDVFNKGITFGKMIFNLSIDNTTDTNLQVVDLLKRSLLKIISIIILPISILLYLFKNKYLLQDKYSPLKVV